MILNHISYKYSGFFLIELLVAIGIFGILSLQIVQLHWKIIEESYSASQYIEGLNIASSVLEEIQAYGPKISDIKIKGQKNEDFNVHVDYVPLPVPCLTKTAQLIKQFQLNFITVSWKSINGKEEKISLYSGSLA